MNLKHWFKSATVALALVTLTPAFAADPANRPGRPGKPEQPGTRPERPGRGAIEIPRLGIPPKVELPEALQKLVDQYRQESEAFLTGQKELLKQLKGATAEEKAKVKETLKENREKFLEEHKELFVEIRQQIAELKKDLKDHAKPIDAGEGTGGGRRRGGN